jgi:hypothetical protein
MGLRVVPLAEPASRIGTGRVEVSEDDGSQPVGPIEIRQDPFHHELARPVRIHRPLRMLLGHGRRLGHPVGRARRGEHDPSYARLHDGVQEMHRGRDVVLIVRARMLDRFSDIGEGCEVHDGVDLVVRDRPPHQRGVGDVPRPDRRPAPARDAREPGCPGRRTTARPPVAPQRRGNRCTRRLRSRECSSIGASTPGHRHRPTLSLLPSSS